jgi:hypothetical protein
MHYLTEVGTLCPFHPWLRWCSGESCVLRLTEHLHCQLLFLVQLQLPDVTNSSVSFRSRVTETGKGPDDM